MKFTGPLTRYGLTVALAVFAADQAIKWVMLVVVDIAARGRITITPFFDLVMVWNTGISYGLFAQDSATGRWILIILSAIAVAALVMWLATAHLKLTAWSLGLVVGGAAGNMLDRILHGAVADFFLLHAFGFSWYVFNLADAAIVAGVALLLYESIFKGHKSAPNRR